MRRVTRRTIDVLLLVAVWLGAPAAAYPCSCISGGPACQAVWNADAVFVGHVAAIAATGNGQSLFVSRRVRVQVLDVFRGELAREVDVYTGAGGGDCGYGFEEGQTYLVYASRGADGRLTTSICHRTRRLFEADDDMAYLRQLPSLAEDSATIFGRVEVDDPATGRQVPMAGSRVAVLSEGVRREAQTDASGRFRLTVAPGRYTIEPDEVTGLYATAASTVVDVRGRGCVEVPIWLRPDGRIVGRILDSSGRPVANLTVHAVSRRDIYSEHATMTNAEGIYELTQLEVGTYMVGTGAWGAHARARRVLHPGVSDPALASAVTVGYGERVVIADLRMPASVPLVTVVGQVKDAAGRAVPGATVYVFDHEDPSTGSDRSTSFAVEPAVTDASGRYRLTTEAGRYRMSAEIRDEKTLRIREQDAGPFEITEDGRVDFVLPD